jgi:hypothetical protein
MSKDLIEGFQNMKFYKFYPIKSEKYPDISEMKVCLASSGCTRAVLSSLALMFVAVKLLAQ